MNFFAGEDLFLGIDIQKAKMCCALMKKRGKAEWQLMAVEEFSLEIQLQDKMKDKSLIKNFIPSRALVATVLSAPEVLVKSLSIPLKGDKEIRAAFNFQIEPLLPYPLEKCLPIYLKVGERAQGSLLTALSVKKESLEKHINFFKEYGVEPEKVFAPAIALTALSSHFYEGDEPFIFMHIAEGGLCCLIEGGKLLAVHSFSKECAEIEKSLLAIQAQNKGKKIETLLLLEEEGVWGEKVKEIFKKQVIVAPPLWGLSEERLAKFGVAIGAAIAASKATASASPHFRTQEFAIFPWRRKRKSIASFLALALCLFGSLIAFEKDFFAKKERMLFENFQHIKKVPLTSLDQLEEELNNTEKNLAHQETLFPLLPKLPKVRDLLSYLASYKDTSVILEDFHYIMIKQPHNGAWKERYQIQVELLISATNALHAEQFHNFLRQPNVMIEDLVWTPIPEKKTYKAQFFLKDKTRYY